MSRFESTLHQLPQPILDKLRSVIRRVRRLLFIRGICATLAAGLAALLVIMAVDATVTLYSPAARWALSLGGLALAGAAAWWYLVRPLSRKITLTHIARILEERHPELQERISTAVELMSSEDPDSIKGSKELIAAVVDSAVVDVGQVDPKAEFKGGRASRFAWTAVAAVAVLALLFAVFPRQAGLLAARAVAPFLDLGNAWSGEIEVRPGDVRVAEGELVTVEMIARDPKLKRAELRLRLPGGGETVERMTPAGASEDGGQRFLVTFPSVLESFDYRVRAGSGLSRYFRVEAVPKPKVEGLTLRYDFPAYTGREPAIAEGGSGEIRALARTEVTVAARLNKPVERARLSVAGAAVEAAPVFAEGQVSWTFPLAPGTDHLWRMSLEDADGFTNDPVDRPVTALPDLPPQIRITAPLARELRLRPSELLPIRYAVSEDIGLTSVTLLVTPEGEGSPRELEQPAPGASAEPGLWHGMAPLNLASLDLAEGQQSLVVQLRARDNLPEAFEGPNEGFSERIVIHIDARAKSLAEQTLAAQKEEMKRAISAAERELSQARSELQQAERELERQETVTAEAMRELDEFREKAHAAQETLRQAAETARDTAFERQGEQLRAVAEEEVASAREAAEMIPVTDDKGQRLAEAREAREQIEEAARQLKEIAASLGENDPEIKLAAQLNELANEQRRLAREAARQQDEARAQGEELSAAEQAAAEDARQRREEEQSRQLADFRRQQERVQRDLGEMLKNNPESLREVLARQQEEAQRLAEQAEAAAEAQQQVQELTQAAMESEAGEQDALREQLLAALHRMQEEVAEDTAGLRQDLEQQQAEAGAPLADASEQARQAAESLGQEDVGAAREAAAQASEALAQASQRSDALAEQGTAAMAPSPAAAEADAGTAGLPPAPEPSPSQAGGQDPDGSDATAAAEAPEDASASSSPSMAQQAPPEPGASEPGSSQPAPAEPGAAEPSSPEMARASGEPSTPGAETAAVAPESPAGSQGAGEEQAGGESAMAAGESAESAAPSEVPAGSPLAAEPARRQLAQLAGRQEMIARQLQAIDSGQFDEALSLMESQLAAEAQALQEEARGLAQETEAARQQQARNQANQASSQLQGAARQAEQAAGQLASAQEAREAGQNANQAQQALRQAQGQQQGAQRGMDQASQSLRQAAEALGQSLQGLEGAPEPQSETMDPRNLAQAFDETSQSARSQDAGEAADRSRQAADSLQQLAQAALQQIAAQGQAGEPDGPPQPGMEGDFAEGADPRLNETGAKSADLAADGVPPELRGLGISAEDWARLTGSVQGGGAVQGGDGLPAEYRDLVGRYFQVIAREAAKSE